MFPLTSDPGDDSPWLVESVAGATFSKARSDDRFGVTEFGG
jgi:hypothetical protein